MDALDVYCDESGFTGQHLLDANQPYFAYGSVAIAPLEASELVAKTIRDFRLQGKELKGKNLVGGTNGRRAASSVLAELGARSQVVVVHKEYALACKLFEYTFEPLISDVSTALYEVNFHKFIGNLLYVWSLAGDERARRFSELFQKAVRDDDGPLRSFLSLHSARTDDPIEALISFCVYNRGRILQEIGKARDGNQFLLDVTTTSLNSLLVWWGRRAHSLRVVCDESGPLSDPAARSFFDAWVGVEEKPSVRLGDREIHLGFNLSAPLALAKSHEEPGIQLADVLSSVAAKTFGDRTEWSKAAGQLLLSCGAISADSIVPESDRVDLDLPETKVNVLILLELLYRSERGESLTAGLVPFIGHMSDAVRRGETGD